MEVPFGSRQDGSARTKPAVFSGLTLCLCAVAAAGCAATTALPWLGLPTPAGESDPRFSALAGALSTEPYGSSSLAPGTQKWGFLILFLSMFLAALSLAVVLKCAQNHWRGSPGTTGLLVVAAIGAAILVWIVMAERAVQIPFGDGTPLQGDVGSVFGMLMACLAAVSAAAGVFAAICPRPAVWIFCFVRSVFTNLGIGAVHRQG